MGQIINELTEAFDYYSEYNNKNLLAKSFQFSEGKRSSEELIPQYSLQNRIRPLFGKNGYNLPSIGNHPDFTYLSGTSDYVYNHVITLFMDIENSTRLNILFAPEKVQKIKNAFICTAIEIIKSFDGHVHRIMGDAVMAFFGGKNTNEFDDIVNALNCGTVLQYFSKSLVKSRLNFTEYPFGIRIGIDYGPKENVLWSSYGYFNMNEVTATSFYVDVASKLQHQAGKNNIMIGDSLKKYADFPDDLLSIKTNSSGEKDYYIISNITDKENKPICYKKYLLDWEKYLDLSIIPQFEESLNIQSSNYLPISISSYLHFEKEGQFLFRYFPVSKVLEKDKAIRFKIDFSKNIEYPYKLKFIVENHGEEAKNKGRENFGNHETVYELTKINSLDKLTHWEHTAYKGLHYMKVQLIKDGVIKNQTKYGVYIK